MHPQFPESDSGSRPAARAPRFYIAAVRASFTVEELAADPVLSELAADDAAWRFCIDDWAARKPSWRHRRAARAWAREGDGLVAERVRMKTAARRAGYLR